MQKTRRITYCDSSCFCPRHHLLYLYRPVSTHIFGIHAVKQKHGPTDSLMRQKGVHVSAVTVNWDNSGGDFLQSEINCHLHLEKSAILHTGFTEWRQAIFPQRRRRGDATQISRQSHSSSQELPRCHSSQHTAHLLIRRRRRRC